MDDDNPEPGPSRRRVAGTRGMRQRPPLLIQPRSLSTSSANRNGQFSSHRGPYRRDPGRGVNHNNGREPPSAVARRLLRQEHISTLFDESETLDNVRDRHNHNKPRYLAFKTIEELSQHDPKEILASIATKRDGFNNLINSHIDRPDVFVLLIKILSKVSLSPFVELKSKLLLAVCNSNFILNLRNFLMDLPYTEKKSVNTLYWKEQIEFWQNFIILIENIFAISPATATSKCRALIESVSKACLEYLNIRHGFVLPQEWGEKLNQLRDKITTYEEKKVRTEKVVKLNDNMGLSDDNLEPPEDFRQLSVMPSIIDMSDVPFLRPNVIKGGYNDVQHYLDVQFRLLREDCFGPLREGIGQYLSNQHKRKYDYIRVFNNVKFLGPHISNLKIGVLVQIDTKIYPHYKNINWAHNKRFLFGSLLIFIRDNSKDFKLGTIMDRDIRHLSAGKLLVSLIDSDFDSSLYNDETYTMIESEVYFEPYFHVMKALQVPSFPEQLAMKQYIVNVDMAFKHPAYLTQDTEYVLKRDVTEKSDISNFFKEISEDIVAGKDATVLEKINLLNKLRRMERENEENNDDDDVDHKYKVLQYDTWPSKEILKLNESQYEAYKLALTHEFSLIQGPPGTGKTYVAVQVAKTLLQNIRSNRRNVLMLVVSYTNHALDQLLEAIAKTTTSIVRIGGQSRNEALEIFNIDKMRNNKQYGNYFMTEKVNLRNSIEGFQDVLMLIDVLNEGVISYDSVKHNIPEINMIGRYYSNIDDDPLHFWLFEFKSEYYTDLHICLNEIQVLLNEDDEDHNRTGKKDYNDEKAYSDRLAKVSSFSTTLVKNQLKLLLKKYKTSKTLPNRSSVEMEILDLYAELKLYDDMVQNRGRSCNIPIYPKTNFSSIRAQNRWMLYFKWVQNKLVHLKATASELQSSVAPSVAAYEEARMMMDVDLILSNNIKVVGLTTTGASKMRKLLEAISPKIVIVEEAAEVLEQHIVTTLTKNCEHLILIGDHQQLRPSASYMKLARQYNIEVSLFERMISNGIHSARLKVQHRMRPEIAALICPHIYSDLQNHPSVENFANVLGVEKNVFFFSHDFKEEEGKVNDSSSKTNHREADMTLALANYIMQQGYEPDDVTILAAYSGQMFYMKKERQNYRALANVKITVVDNYQGEESKIILLSLVRNNSDNKIGFLGTENRICVALSRAKEGFYMFGNIDTLKLKSELWQKIAATLESNGSVVKSIKLKCQNHPDQITDISCQTDFEKVPEGGCLQACNFQYSCGHLCVRLCHGYDRKHIKTTCDKRCERILCELEHVCPLWCREECQPCKVLVPKTLPCSHEVDVCCYLEPEDPTIKCRVEMQVTLPDCGHENMKLCYMKIDDVKCTVPCVFRLSECGHVCTRSCHVKDDPEHEKYTCMKPCARAKKGCSAGLIGDRGPHQCLKMCHENCDDCNELVKKKRSNCKHVDKVVCCKDVDEIPCKKKCTRTMECGHFCKKKCFETCGDCKQLVIKPIPDCKHMIRIECMRTPTRAMCTAKCNRLLACGHPCKARCADACDASKCLELSNRVVEAPCGHPVKLPCNAVASFDEGTMKASKLLDYCKKKCGVELCCGHACGGSCAACHQGRLHAPCRQPCARDFVCGHRCQEPCNQICPPCNMACEVKCPHSHCKNKCGEPCTPCAEECSRRCPHGSCSRRCGEACSRAACGAACAARLACGHACRGLCGEPCPALCARCAPAALPVSFLTMTNDEYADDDKFILLQDCGHVIEVQEMDNLMSGDRKDINIRTCPTCRKPIINTMRYKDIVNNTLQNYINPIKTKIYGNEEQIKTKKLEFNIKSKDILRTHVQVYTDHHIMKNTINTLVNFNTNLKKKSCSLLEIEMQLVFLNIFEMITECYEKYDALQQEEKLLAKKFENHVNLLLSVLKFNNNTKMSIKITEQQQNDFNRELKRLNAIIQFSKLYKVAKSLYDDPKVKEQTKQTKSIIFSFSPFDEDKAIESMQTLQKLIKQTGFITRQLRQVIVQAVGLKAGHWFKCPNGHLYCIDRCGGAMEESVCPDCGAIIGGTNHRLRQGNSHAPEMDGSSFAAYSEEANNLANFDMDDLQ